MNTWTPCQLSGFPKVELGGGFPLLFLPLLSLFPPSLSYLTTWMQNTVEKAQQERASAPTDLEVWGLRAMNLYQPPKFSQREGPLIALSYSAKSFQGHTAHWTPLQYSVKSTQKQGKVRNYTPYRPSNDYGRKHEFIKKKKHSLI